MYELCLLFVSVSFVGQPGYFKYIHIDNVDSQAMEKKNIRSAVRGCLHIVCSHLLGMLAAVNAPVELESFADIKAPVASCRLIDCRCWLQ